jgi:hypothetical protein
MSNQYQRCANCGQYINTAFYKHYQATEGDETVYLHLQPCLEQYQAKHEIDDIKLVNCTSRKS